jgi:branched-chain amino acid transport system permease protein
MLFQSWQSLLRLLVVFFGLILLVTRRIVHSAYGHALLAIREDEVAAEALGINLTWHKVSIFAVSAAYAGLAGSFFVVFLGVASPESYGFNTSLTILIMSMVGGMGSIGGALLGVTVLTLFSELTRDYPVYSMMAYGLLLTFIIIYFPRGLAGFLQYQWERIRQSRRSIGEG